MEKAKLSKWLVALSLLLTTNLACADWWALNMRKGVTDISLEVYDLHMLIFWICVAISIVVFGVMIFSMLMHRKSLGYTPSKFHHSAKMEIVWTLVPIIILVAMAVPATKTLNAIHLVGEGDIDIKVTGLQWKWQYTYINDNPAKEVSFISSLRTPQEEIRNQVPKREHYLLDVDKELVIPINKRIRFLITSADVIHSWWVPDFAIKKDAIPGYIHESWAVVNKPGIYRGQCAELCGKDHGFMPVVVRAVEQAEYDAWMAEQQAAATEVFQTVRKQWTQAELLAEGEQVYNQACSSCHQPNGQGLPPAFPSLVGQGISLGPIEKHIDIVMNGRAGTAMQAFGAQLNAAQIAAVITYERNAWGNNTGDSVQPKKIHAMQGGQ